jgi:hypothetical protein
MKLLALSLVLLAGHTAPIAPTSFIELKGYFACMQSSLVPGENALSCYAPTQCYCQNGAVILAYEKHVTPSSPLLPRYLIADTVRLTLRYPNNNISISNCTNVNGQTKQYFVLCKYDAFGKKYLRNVLRVWGVNAQGHLVEVPLKTLKCLNDDYGA